MEVLVLDDVLNELADLLGIYGTCPNDDGCEASEKCICRNGFIMEFENKIRMAIDNEKCLDEIKIKYPKIDKIQIIRNSAREHLATRGNLIDFLPKKEDYIKQQVSIDLEMNVSSLLSRIHPNKNNNADVIKPAIIKEDKPKENTRKKSIKYKSLRGSNFTPPKKKRK